MPVGRSIDEKLIINGSLGSRSSSSVIGISTDLNLTPPGVKMMVPF